jgi:hypothetical protein
MAGEVLRNELSQPVPVVLILYQTIEASNLLDNPAKHKQASAKIVLRYRSAYKIGRYSGYGSYASSVTSFRGNTTALYY